LETVEQQTRNDA